MPELHPAVAPAAAPQAAFTAQEARRYWDERHATSDALSSGGHISLGMAGNAILYAVRLARLVEALGSVTSASAPLRVLDAGCGKGYFSRGMAGFGFLVDGIDTSAAAIAECVTKAGPGETYTVSALEDWSPTHLYDAVVCIDVLYHLMDDAEWERSIRSLSAHVRLGGLVALVDHDREQDRDWSRYQRTRARSRYATVLEDLGFGPIRHVPNNLPGDPSGFHVAQRVA